VKTTMKEVRAEWMWLTICEGQNGRGQQGQSGRELKRSGWSEGHNRRDPLSLRDKM